MPTINMLSAFIGWGSSVSSVVDTGGNYVVGIIMPQVWKDARVSVLISPDGAEYHDLFDFNMGELLLPATPGVAIAVDYRRLLMARYIKLRSGTRDVPVNQDETVHFNIITADVVGGAQATPKAAVNEKQTTD